MVLSCLSTASHPKSIEVLLGFDRDDPHRGAYWPLLADKRFTGACGRFYLHDGVAGRTVSQVWNELADCSKGDILLMANDDLIFETQGWDEALRAIDKSVPDRIYVAYCEDGINGERHAAFPAVSRKWVNTLGYFAPDVGFHFFYNDTWIFELGKALNRLYFIRDHKIAHNHYTLKDGVCDETTHRNREHGQHRHDSLVWKRTAVDRMDAATILLRAIEEPVKA